MNKDTAHMLATLQSLGISWQDACALRRISMKLHRWHELECGTEYGAVERDEKTGKTFWYRASDGRRSPCRDDETGALKRLAKIMAGYKSGPNGLSYYVQGDPRGAALYILRSGDVPTGCEVDAYYSRGIAVFK